MKKLKIIKKLLKAQTKGMSKIIKDQEEIINGDIHDVQTKIDCNYSIGYATAMNVIKKNYIPLFSYSKKELKQLVKSNKKIHKKNQKTMNDLFDSITNQYSDIEEHNQEHHNED